MLTEKDIEATRTRSQSARSGTWISFVEGRDHWSGSSFIRVGDSPTRADDIELSGATIADQAFKANARQDIPNLLEEIARLRKILEEG